MQRSALPNRARRALKADMNPIVKFAKKFMVRHSSQLTSRQPYVYCNTQETAEAVAHCFHVGSRVVEQYRWQREPEAKEKPHWCVTPDVEWALCEIDEVAAGQFFVGPWDTAEAASKVLLDLLKGEDTIDGYFSSVGPVEGEDGFVLVRVERGDLELLRSHLEPGDTFEYLHDPGTKYVVACAEDGPPPAGWLVSMRETAWSMDCWDKPVKRIPHWGAKKAKRPKSDEKPTPVVLPCVSPLDDFERLGSRYVLGLSGLECLERYEAALKTERFGRRNGKVYVELPEGVVGIVGSVVGGLVAEQVDHAKLMWSAKLKKLAAEKRATDAEMAQRNALSVEDQDELPNMVYVDG